MDVCVVSVTVCVCVVSVSLYVCVVSVSLYVCVVSVSLYVCVVSIAMCDKTIELHSKTSQEDIYTSLYNTYPTTTLLL